MTFVPMKDEKYGHVLARDGVPPAPMDYGCTASVACVLEKSKLHGTRDGDFYSEPPAPPC